jgi:dTDP-4-amino-4,6-dideoxygalactose transaminase
MSNISAGIGRGQMNVLVKHIKLRRMMHEFYLDLFKEFDGVSVYTVPNENYFANYWLTAILINQKTKGITE